MPRACTRQDTWICISCVSHQRRPHEYLLAWRTQCSLLPSSVTSSSLNSHCLVLGLLVQVDPWQPWSLCAGQEAIITRSDILICIVTTISSLELCLAHLKL